MGKKEKKTSNASKEFSRFAKAYDQYSIIQSEVAKTLVSKLPENSYKTIIDIGAGSGRVYQNLLSQNISFEHFIALDSSSEMLEIHPDAKSVKKVCSDFNCTEVFDTLEQTEDTLLLSSSALQWSTDPEATFVRLSQLASRAHFAIFTSNTFKTLHQSAGIHSPIYSTDRLKSAIGKHYHANYEVRQYKLHFDAVYEMFRYIKKSGVSGGEKKLGYKETKVLMEKYPLDYLEFEVLFAEGKRR
ncbi:Biotin synthesis protein BioC [hydrothermal vent metagenome]|uniref:Biotin synthesis protein BioC n=1 Tax=hydrothermal vent metagenome TaxID=652676 RepID=A0A1W1BUA7_9ZZZZ